MVPLDCELDHTFPRYNPNTEDLKMLHAMRDAVRAAMDPDNPPPIRIALPGMCFRYEQITARSDIQFYQVEGLAVAEGITFGHSRSSRD